MSESVYKRVLLKLSGESLAEQDGGFGIDVRPLKTLPRKFLMGKTWVLRWLLSSAAVISFAGLLPVA